MEIGSKLINFDVDNAYKERTLDELNGLAAELNVSKKMLSKNVGWYLENSKKVGIEKYDIHRLCRALAAPGHIAGKILDEQKVSRPLGYVENEHTLNFKKDVGKKLLSKIPGYYRDSLGNSRIEAMEKDINELGVYAHMYLEIDMVKDLEPKMFPNGNIFDDMIDIMGMGGLIVRFKYVSRKRSAPEERVVSYHLANSVSGPELAVHVEGDRRFSMRKMWGQGDEKLDPVNMWYKDAVIRWGKNDVQRKLDGLEKKNETFLY